MTSSWQILPRVYAATEHVMQSADLQLLVRFSSALCCDESTSSTAVLTDANHVNRLVSVLQNKVRHLVYYEHMFMYKLDQKFSPS